MNESLLMEAFIESEINMLTELRMGNGLDHDEYEKCIQALSELSTWWEKEDSIPEEAVLTIIEIYAELYLFSDNYMDEEKDRIKEAAEQFKTVREQFLASEGIQEHDQESLIRNLVKAIDENNGFFVQLEQGKGMDKEQFEKIFLELERVTNEISSWERIPKSIITLLISFYEMILHFKKYKYELNMPVEADKIYDAYERVFAQIAG
ncbi:hypothetical protein [Paucisalibacillus sp. EB02]|uniref:hypothetical protein n=1 Tax=Paucisalibacillus sp. EB02 TaxID=1347087 RepID=UPI0004B04244|nr:hypothetical protein [Paucisalibacillus sp. EB02]